MKIKELHIYGYGKFENLRLTDISAKNIFYGENEAGKSTIMSFLLSILFGFPTKQQQELRYEPKNTGKYGGSIVVETRKYGKVMIERTKGKAAGDVTVTFADGTIAGEERLKELLGYMDKQLYRDIFAFNLQGLQSVQQISGEDLGKYLFSASTMGSDRLLQVENKLKKELEVRFKPNGKKPLLNRKITAMRKLHAEVADGERENDQYWRLLEQKDEQSSEMEKITGHLHHLRQLHAKLLKWKEIAPLFQAKKVIEEEISKLPETSLPNIKLAQLDYLDEAIAQIGSRLSRMKQRKALLEENKHHIEPLSSLFEKEEEITLTVNKLPLIEQWLEEKKQLEIKIEQQNDRITDFREKLHSSLSTEELLSCDTSIFMKEKTAEAQKNFQLLQEKKQLLEEEFQKRLQELEDIEKRLDMLRADTLPDQERERLLEIHKQFEDKKYIERKRQEAQERIQFLQRQQIQEDKKHRKGKIQFTVFALLFAALLIAGIAGKEWMMTAAGLAGVLYCLFFMIQKKNTELIQEVKLAEEQEQALVRQLALFDGKDFIHTAKVLEQDQAQRDELIPLQAKYQEKNEQYEHVLKSFEQYEAATKEHERKALAFVKALHLPKNIALSHAYDAFTMIEQFKAAVKEQTRLSGELAALTTVIQEWTRTIKGLAATFSEKTFSSHVEASHFLQKKLQEEKERLQQYHEISRQLLALEDEIQQIQLEKDKIAEEIMAILAEAGAGNAEEYRELAKQQTHKEELIEKRKTMELQIKLSGLSKEELNEFTVKAANEDDILGVEDEIKKYEAQLLDRQEKQADVKYKLAVLEEGTSYSELLHQFQQQKDELRKEVLEWFHFAIANQILENTVAIYKQKRLPQMLKQAEKYFAFLTEQQYVHIFPHEEQSGFSVERNDQLFFEASELSQATKEQLYTALRLALITTIYQHVELPVFIDDSFVNFDKKRGKKVMELFFDSLTEKQIFLFTCHENFTLERNDIHFISLSRINGKKNAADGRFALSTGELESL
ncbi:AAA family ATPase [Bacillaceae bacterium Marseille-Q3522]|nr:AAA family ATPase [Bacillaceae bacterium Marseille-Q3522]